MDATSLESVLCPKQLPMVSFREYQTSCTIPSISLSFQVPLRHFLFVLSLFIYFESERERESTSRGGSERERERERENPKRAQHHQLRARRGAQSHECETMT